MKKKSLFALAAIVFVAGGSAGLYLFQKQSSAIRQCPDEWVEDRMPTSSEDDKEKQYFIINGERKDIKDYDVDWVKSNCSVQVQYVY